MENAKSVRKGPRLVIGSVKVNSHVYSLRPSTPFVQKTPAVEGSFDDEGEYNDGRLDQTESR